MMNFTQFLKGVDQVAAAMSKELLAEFIHDTARTLPQNQREDFLYLAVDTFVVRCL